MTLNLDRSTWTHVRFGDVVSNVNETMRDPLSAGIDRVIAMEHLEPGELKITRWGSLEDGTTFTRRARPGQTLFGKRRAYQRKAAYAEFDAICSGDILTFQANPTRLIPELLPFLVQSDGFYEHALGTSAGSLSPRTNWKDLATHEFDLPPLDEQHRIADLLWSLEMSHADSVAMRASVLDMQRLLLARLLSGNWPQVPFQELGSVLMGRQRAPRYETGSSITPYLRVANIGDDELRLSDVKSMNFDERDRTIYSLEPNDILVSEGQSRELVGQAARITEVDGPLCFQNTLIRFRPDASVVLPDYAYAIVRACFYAGKFAEIASQTTSIAHLGVRRFAELSVPVPPIDVQRRQLMPIQEAARTLSDAESHIAAVATLRSQLRKGVLG